MLNGLGKGERIWRIQHLEDLQKSLQKIVDSIRAKKNEQQIYLNKANEVQEVYNRLLQDKRTMKEYRNEIKTFMELHIRIL